MNTNFVELESGLLIPEAAAEEIASAQRRETGVDVFAGAGGFSLGFIKSGFKVLAAIENDPYAVMTYMCNLCRWGQVKMHFIDDIDEKRLEKALQKHFKEQEKSKTQLDFDLAGSGWIASQPEDTPSVPHMIVGDVRKLTGKRLLEIIGLEKGELGCMFGGPPCQGFSYSNSRRRPGEPRNSLVFEFARLIIDTMPQTIVMENVPGIVTMTTEDGVPVVERFCKILRDGGFHGVEAFENALRRPGAIGAMRKDGKKKRGKSTGANRANRESREEHHSVPSVASCSTS